MGKDAYWTSWGDPFIMYVNVKSSCSTPETEKILYQLYFCYKVKMVNLNLKETKDDVQHNCLSVSGEDMLC